MKKHSIAILSIFVSSCNLITNNEGRIENVIDSAVVFDASVALKQQNTTLSKIAYDFKVISLEATSESIVSDIRNVNITDNRIYIYDTYKNGGVVIFDTQGNFLKRLAHGQGPDEIGTASDMNFDKTSGNLFVSDQTNMKVLKFTKDGEFISYQPDPIRGVSVSVIDNVILHTQQRFQNFNDKFQIIKEDTLAGENVVWMLEQEPFVVIVRPNFQFYEDGMNIYIPYSGNIYYYKGGKIYKKYTIFGNSGVDLQDFESFWDALEAVSDNEYLPMGKFAETKDFLYGCLAGKNNNVNIFINKSTGAINYTKTQRHDFQNYIHIIGSSNSNENEILAIVMPEWLFGRDDSVEHWDGIIPENIFSDADMEKLKAVTPDDNPIIVLFKLKDDI